MSTFEAVAVTLRDGRQVLLRHAVPDDAPALIAFLAGVEPESEYILLAPGEKKPTVEQEQAWVRGYLDNPGSLLLIAAAGAEIIAVSEIGRGSFRRTSHQGGLGISIRQAWRGVGLGTVMMRSLIDWAQASPFIEKVCLHVFAGNSHALALYRRMGFVEEGRLLRQLKMEDGRYEDEIVMSRWVKPTMAKTGV